MRRPGTKVRGVRGSPWSPNLLFLTSVPTGAGPSWSGHPEARCAVGSWVEPGGTRGQGSSRWLPPGLGSTNLRVGWEEKPPVPWPSPGHILRAQEPQEGMGKASPQGPSQNHTLDVSRQLSHFPAGDPGTKRSTHASWLEVWAPSTLAGCLPPAGPPSSPDCLHPEKPKPFLQSCLCRISPLGS